VNDDEHIRLTAQQMVQAQRQDWTLEVFHRSCPSSEPESHTGPAHPVGQEAVPSLSSPPDLVLIGLSDSQQPTLTCVRRIKALAPRLIAMIIGGDIGENEILEYCAAGANGVLLKLPAPEAFAEAVSSLAQGWPVLCPEAQNAILGTLHGAGEAAAEGFPGLSGREHDIAACLVARLSDKEISTRLGIEEATVHVHLTRIYRKLGVHGRRQAGAKLLGVGGGRQVTLFSPFLFLDCSGAGGVMAPSLWCASWQRPGEARAQDPVERRIAPSGWSAWPQRLEEAHGKSSLPPAGRGRNQEQAPQVMSTVRTYTNAQQSENKLFWPRYARLWEPTQESVALTTCRLRQV
jgi:DNA-binding NarL/FixJ family response regulator